MTPDAQSSPGSRSDRPEDEAPPAEAAWGAGAPADDEPELDGGDEDVTDLAGLEPTDEEIAAWAARERERRRAWLEGPTDDERAAWARRERVRRLTELGPALRATDLARKGRRYGRETMLASEGAANLMVRWSRRVFAELVRAGLEWEDEISRSPRRRIRLDDEER
jgi:hypothetical protein